MSTGWHVTAQDIVKWTETDPRQAQETLPLLVKRLIFASITPSLISFPSGDSIMQRGWDGVLKTSFGNAFVPAGDSAWELSTQKAIDIKANNDYRKRTDNSGHINKKTSTFVFVTNQSWPDSEKWALEKKSEGEWANITVLTSQRLADWLHGCPAVHRWFAGLIRNRPNGAWDAEQAWDSWSLSTKPQCSADLVIASRGNESQELYQLLSSKPDIISVSAETKDEAYAFILATIKTYISLLPRLLIVRDPKEWDELVDSSNPLILIPLFDNLPTLSLATQHGNWVIVPLCSEFAKNARIVLSEPKEANQVEALIKMGLPKEVAQRVVKDSKGKLHLIRRHGKLAQIGQQKPDWANPGNAEPLVPVLLAGSWLSDNKNDCDKVAYLAGMPYERLEEHLNKWLRTGDYPAKHSGNRWQIVSIADLWQFLSPYISESILKRFGEVVTEVLKELNPRFELVPEERWLAPVKGKVTKFSVPLRHGLATGLAILGSYGDRDCKNTGRYLIQDQVSYWIKQILIDNMSEQLWGSVAPELPLLAEASPEVFLEAVHAGSEGEKPPIACLFVEEGPMGGCLFAGLVWGIKCISWKYTSQAVFALAKLASLDPGGKWSSRPYDALKEIFRGWLPQTKASLDDRLKMIDSLIRFSPKLGWKLLIDLLPERGGSMSFPIYHPNFRDWQNGWQQGVSVIEYNKHTVAISERIIGYIKEEPETRWLTVIENLSNMPLPYIAMAVNQLDKDLPNLPHAVVSKINEELRKLISNHRRFSTAKWALPKPYVDRIAVLYQKTLPEDLGIRYKFLFDSGFPEIANPLPFLRHQESFEHIEEQRKNALEDIWNKLQIAGIEQLVKAVELPGLLGTSLENTTFSDQIESIVLNWLDNQDPLYVQTAQAYVRARCTRRKNDWLEYIYLKYKNAWSDKTWVNFCLGLPFNKRLFDFLGQINGTAKELFWENCNRYYLATEDSAYANSVLKELLRHKRPFAAISAASNYLHTLKNWDIDYELLAQSLEKAISEAVNAIPSSRDIYYDFQTIITKIQECGNLDQKRLARIEWLYMPIYRHNEIRPKVLTKEVLENAEFFVDLICLMFRANPPTENELPELPAPLRELQAQSAFYLLHLISEIPGQHGSNEVIATELEEWVKEARQRCTQKNRKVIGDEQIGEILSYAPVGKDNIWPHEAVRDIIEQCASPDIERGIEVGRFNQGGATVRASSAGGEQERKIAEDYASQAEKIKFEFPRTASMLLRLADTYRHQATFEDREILED